MTFEELCILRRSYHEFDLAVTKTEKSLVSVDNGIALDYVVKVLPELRQFKSEEDFEKEAKMNERNLKLKNAFMVYWIQIKEERKKPSLKDILNELIQKNIRDRKLRAAGIDPEEEEEKLKQKEKQMKKR